MQFYLQLQHLSGHIPTKVTSCYRLEINNIIPLQAHLVLEMTIARTEHVISYKLMNTLIPQLPHTLFPYLFHHFFDIYVRLSLKQEHKIKPAILIHHNTIIKKFF